MDSPADLVAGLLSHVNVTALADVAALDRKALYRYATPPDNESGEHRPLPLALAPLLEIAAGSTTLVDWHAAALGGVFVRAMDIDTPDPSALFDAADRLTELCATLRREAALLTQVRLTRVARRPLGRREAR